MKNIHIDNVIVDLAKHERRPRTLQDVLRILVVTLFVVYVLVSLWASLSGQKDITLFSLLILAPLLAIVNIIEQKVLKVEVQKLARELQDRLNSILYLIDSDLGMFDVKLASALRNILDKANNPELFAFGGLLGYGRIFGIRENTAPVLENSKPARQQLHFLFSNVVNSLGTQPWSRTFEDLGSVLAYLASLSIINHSNELSDRTSAKAFSRFLRSRASEIYAFRLWSASSYVYKTIHNFRDSFAKEFAPWAALILFWLNAQLVSFANRSINEMGGLFASEYQLLAHRLLILADAVEYEDWNKVAEVLIASHKTNKTHFWFELRQPTF